MINIRALTQSDWPDWHRLWTAYLEFYETTLPEATIESAFSRLLDPATNVNGLLALADETPVGLVHYIYHEHMWHPQGVCYLQDLFATPETRGAGVGRALIQAVYAAADAAGKPNVYWLTQDFNTEARLLYDRIGELSPFIKYDRP